MAEDDASDDLLDDSTEEATEDGPGESNGVDSEAGRSLMLTLASRLQTGQKVLHEVSQESTQTAWNSATHKVITLRYAIQINNKLSKLYIQRVTFKVI